MRRGKAIKKLVKVKYIIILVQQKHAPYLSYGNFSVLFCHIHLYIIRLERAKGGSGTMEEVRSQATRASQRHRGSHAAPVTAGNIVASLPQTNKQKL